MKDAELKALLERLDGRSERLETTMRVGFERTDARFDRMDTRFERMEGRFERMEERFAELSAHMDDRLAHLRDTVAGHFEALELRLRQDRPDRW